MSEPQIERSITPFKLMLALRDGRNDEIRGAVLLLMHALILRCQPDKFRCWPSYQQLHLDTHLNETVLRRAARDLEKLGYLKREARNKQSNMFHVNFERILEEAARKRSEILANDEGEQQPIVYSKPIVEPTRDQIGVAGALIGLFREVLPGHPVLASTDGVTGIEQSLYQCMAEAGGEFYLQDVIFDRFGTMSGKVKDELAHSTNLAACLSKYIRKWLRNAG